MVNSLSGLPTVLLRDDVDFGGWIEKSSRQFKIASSRIGLPTKAPAGSVGWWVPGVLSQ